MSLAQNDDNQVMIVAAGAIPPLVQLLRAGSRAGVQRNAAGTLLCLTYLADNHVAIAAAGAIPPLVELVRPGSDDRPREYAARTLAALDSSSAGNRAAIDAAGADADVDMLEEVERLGVYDDNDHEEEEQSGDEFEMTEDGD
ncbi:hypothetical protein FOA52_000923 [Chlamydomonas sp. UWO 241]|nr:hypothetical protein FOA52_000923 [Chlamydomonas sp. UWO 241]